MEGYYKKPHSPEQWSNNDLEIWVDDERLAYRLVRRNSCDAVSSFTKATGTPSEYVYENELGLSDLFRCTSSNRQITQPHAIIGVGHRVNDKVRVYDFFRHSAPTRSTTGHAIAAQLGIQQGFYLGRAWADTPLTEWKVWLSATNIRINGVDQPKTNMIKTIDGNGLTDVMQFFPNISLTFDGGTVKARILNPDGSIAARENIELFLETTTGVLMQNRLLTDINGYAETKLLCYEKGVIKAGFKHYPSKVEVRVNVR